MLNGLRMASVAVVCLLEVFYSAFLAELFKYPEWNFHIPPLSMPKKPQFLEGRARPVLNTAP